MSIPVLYVRGDYYHVGYQTGLTFKDRIKDYFNDFSDLKNRFLPFYSTKLGKQIYDNFLQTVSKSCPHFVEEVKGIADGCSIDFTEVFLMHLRSELQTYLTLEMVPECSSVYVNNDHNYLLCHNEDTSAAVNGRGYVVAATVTNDKNDAINGIWAFCYPGTIPGNAFGFNSQGLVITANALYPKFLQLDGTIPRQFVNRLCLEATSPSNLFQIVKDPLNSIATGCSINVAAVNQRDMMNLELCPSSDSTLIGQLPITTTHYMHFNMYDHMQVQQLPDRTTSSEHRKAAAFKLPTPHNVQSALDVLGDESDQEYPIYRTPRPTDVGCTVATAAFDLLKKRISIYLDNPKLSQPVMTTPISF
ncbi:hypothetical protein CHUAL_003116 [Chamberlinius hualienensis]